MSKLVWDQIGEKFYETGIEKGVLYVTNAQGAYPKGVAWNGLTGVDESPSGAEPTKIYADNINYLNLYSAEEFGGTIKAYTYPEEFEECDGSASLAEGLYVGQQDRRAFGFSYSTKVGNDIEGDKLGHKIKLIYGCKASPSSKSYQTINDSPEAIEFSWEITTTPVPVGDGFKPSATLTIDSRKTTSEKLKAIEDILYGVDAPAFDETKTYAVGEFCTHEENIYECKTEIATAGVWDATKWNEVTQPGPRLPLPSEVIAILR